MVDTSLRSLIACHNAKAGIDRCVLGDHLMKRDIMKFLRHVLKFLTKLVVLFLLMGEYALEVVAEP